MCNLTKGILTCARYLIPPHLTQACSPSTSVKPLRIYICCLMKVILQATQGHQGFETLVIQTLTLVCNVTKHNVCIQIKQFGYIISNVLNKSACFITLLTFLNISNIVFVVV